MPSNCSFATANDQPINALISNHRDALAKSENACAEHDASRNAWLAACKADPIFFPLMHGDNVLGRIDLPLFTPAEAAQRIRNEYARLRSRAMLDPDTPERSAAITLINADEKRAQTALKRSLALHRQRLLEFGLAALSDEVETCSDAEERALTALLAYRPENLHEMRVKSTYLLERPALVGSDDQYVRLLLESMV